MDAEELLEKPTPQREAATIVHRKLGTSKHFSESDKRDTAAIIVSGLESLHERWNAETERLKDRLEAAHLENQYKDALQSTITAQTLHFAKCQGRRLETHAHDMTTTTELLLQLNDCLGMEPTLDLLERLLGKTSKLMRSMDSFCYEREKCRQLLQLSDDSRMSIAGELQKRRYVVLAEDEDGAGSLENSESLDETIDRLAKDSVELQEMVKEGRKEVTLITQKTKEADREIERLRLQIACDDF